MTATSRTPTLVMSSTQLTTSLRPSLRPSLSHTPCASAVIAADVAMSHSATRVAAVLGGSSTRRPYG